MWMLQDMLGATKFFSASNKHGETVLNIWKKSLSELPRHVFFLPDSTIGETKKNYQCNERELLPATGLTTDRFFSTLLGLEGFAGGFLGGGGILRVFCSSASSFNAASGPIGCKARIASCRRGLSMPNCFLAALSKLWAFLYTLLIFWLNTIAFWQMSSTSACTWCRVLYSRFRNCTTGEESISRSVEAAHLATTLGLRNSNTVYDRPRIPRDTWI